MCWCVLRNVASGETRLFLRVAGMGRGSAGERCVAGARPVQSDRMKVTFRITLYPVTSPLSMVTS
jgi:hypothetical protein